MPAATGGVFDPYADTTTALVRIGVLFIPQAHRSITDLLVVPKE